MTASTLQRTSAHRSEVGPIELFFDLVYVFAIIQLSYLLIDNLSWAGAANIIVVFAAVWWGWNYTAWAMNWLNPRNVRVQILTGVLMLAALGMSIAIPEAFGEGAWLFVACYLFMGIVRPVFMMIAFRGQQLAKNYRMLMIWTCAAGVFWVAGCFADPQLRLLLWLAAVVVDYTGPMAQFRIPGAGSAPMHLWDTDPKHLAERNQLVFIIALGESILLMGGTAVSASELTILFLLNLLVGFALLMLLWWNYFSLAGLDTQRDDGSTAALRTAYAYAHAFMVLGAILVAVSIQLRLSHENLTPAIVFVTVAGPVIYLIGNLLFLRSRFGRMARSRFVAIALLVLIGAAALPFADRLWTIVLGIAVLAVMLLLTVFTVMRRANPALPTAHSD